MRARVGLPGEVALPAGLALAGHVAVGVVALGVVGVAVRDVVAPVAQLEENVAALDRLNFTEDELEEIDRYATESGINLWAQSSED